MATDNAAEAMPDRLSSHPRVDDIAFELRVSVDGLLSLLRNQHLTLNPGDRAPRQVVFAALDAELAAGRYWRTETLDRYR